ncbi:acyl-CoA synthetase [Rhodococcus sp. NPDC057135]|uniref:acyl-CoA synthetase n=1 Tax=Rhodococcus sp. NPDC057135 TaxID=3346028 RepID=UPI00362F1FF8
MLLTALQPSFPVPDSPDALVIGDTHMSRADLLHAAQAIIASLPTTGVVAVNAQPTVDTIVAITACLLANVPVVPIPPDCGKAELTHFLTDSGAIHWLGPTPEICDVHAIISGNRTLAAVPRVGTDTALVVYTSGTTGAPKGVELTESSLAAGLDAIAEAWSWTAADIVVHGLPLFHLHGLILGTLGSLRIGSRVVHTRPKPAAYAAANGTLYFGVPTIWSRIADDPDAARSLRSARLLVSGSASLPVQVYDRLVELTGQAPLERYGMSETQLTLSTRPDERRRGWVGRPVAGMETRLRGEDGGMVTYDGETIGQLEVRGPSLFRGYLGRPDDTARSFTDDGWFVTGDLAVRDPSGFHRIVGRASTDLIKSGGYRIGAGEIETSLFNNPTVKEVAVVGLPDDDLGERLVAYIVPADDLRDKSQIEQELIEYVDEHLSRHKRPREFRIVNSLPRNAMGKVQKKLIIEQAKAVSLS